MGERLLMADVIQPHGAPVEAEPVRVDCFGDRATLVLDDGTQVVLRRSELHEAVIGPDREADAA